MGREWIGYAYCMEEITTEANKMNICDLRKIFGLPPEVPLLRPHGKVDKLIDADCCCCVAVVITLDNLQLMKNQFEFCVRGYYPSLRVECAYSHTV